MHPLLTLRRWVLFANGSLYRFMSLKKPSAPLIVIYDLSFLCDCPEEACNRRVWGLSLTAFASRPPYKMPFLKAGSFRKSSYQIKAQVKSVAASCAFRLLRSCDYARLLKVSAALPLLAKEHGFPQRRDCVRVLFYIWNGPHLLRSSVNISAIQQSSLMLDLNKIKPAFGLQIKKDILCASFKHKATQPVADRGSFFLNLHKIFIRDKNRCYGKHRFCCCIIWKNFPNPQLDILVHKLFRLFVPLDIIYTSI